MHKKENIPSKRHYCKLYLKKEETNKLCRIMTTIKQFWKLKPLNLSKILMQFRKTRNARKNLYTLL